MKIAFSSPYFDSMSGGERYLLTLASHWSETHDVSVFWDDPAILKQTAGRLHIDLGNVKTVPNIFETENVFKKMFVTRGYDLIFFLTDGSVPTSFAKYNILHFQVPFQHVPIHPIKLGRFQAIVCNSDFTKRNIDSRLGNRAVVIYPPVEPIKKSRIAKQKIILSVGRFHPAKKQDILIEAFRKGKFGGYELVMTGGLLPADEAYVKRLKLAAGSLPVKILPNISFEKLTLLYNQSDIYWHAAGFHEMNPEDMEHFGISTVEAMSAGAVPIVFNGGGLPEIVREGEDGFLWANIDDLIDKTNKVISAPDKYAVNARVRSREFSDIKFATSFDKLLASITQ